MRAAIIFPALYIVALGVAVLATGPWFGAGIADLATELERGLNQSLTGVSLALIVLSSWIAHALATGRARRTALAIGWLTALPGLIVVFVLLVDGTAFFRMLGCDDVGVRGGYRCGNALIASAFTYAIGLALVAAHTLPFSAGLILFGLGFGATMIARAAISLVRRRKIGNGS